MLKKYMHHLATDKHVFYPLRTTKLVLNQTSELNWVKYQIQELNLSLWERDAGYYSLRVTPARVSSSKTLSYHEAQKSQNICVNVEGNRLETVRWHMKT